MPATAVTGAPATNPDFEAIADLTRAVASSNGSAAQSVQLRSDVFTGVGSGAQDVVVPFFDPTILRLNSPRATLLDLIPTKAIDSDTYVGYIEVGGITGNAAVPRRTGSPATYGSAPESTVATEKITINLGTIMAHTPSDLSTFKDSPQLFSLITDRLAINQRLAANAMLVAVSDTTDGLSSIAVTGEGRAQSRTYDVAGDDNADTLALIEAIRLAALDVELTNLPANVAVMSPATYAKIQLAKNSIGNFYEGGPFTASQDSIWGLKIAVEHSLNGSDEVIVGSTVATTLCVNGGTEITTGTVGDDFLKRAIKVLITTRALLVNARPEAWCVITPAD